MPRDIKRRYLPFLCRSHREKERERERGREGEGIYLYINYMHVGRSFNRDLWCSPSTMDDSATVTKPWSLYPLFKTNIKERSEKNEMVEDEDEEECDMEVWETLSQSFFQVQSALDQNRTLIHQVNESHQSRIPDNLAKNVELIREINRNISKVLSIYSELSVNFSCIVHQRRAIMASRNHGDGSVDGKEEGKEA